MSEEEIMIRNQVETIKYLQQENDRLNNIINELEKYLNEMLWFDNESDEYRIASDILDKLKELKESEVN